MNSQEIKSVSPSRTVDFNASVITLKFVGPFYQSNMAQSNIYTLRDLVTQGSTLSSASRVEMWVRSLARNQRAGQLVHAHSTEKVAECNHRVCVSLIDILIYAKQHPDELPELALSTLRTEHLQRVRRQFAEGTSVDSDRAPPFVKKFRQHHRRLRPTVQINNDNRPIEVMETVNVNFP